MSLTKIGSIGVSTGIQFAGVTTIATLNSSDNVLSVGGTVNFVSDVSIGGTVSIAGTLTYEDVTNVDAVGLITARNGIVVGSGITLSKDGDGFFTGVTTATTFVGALTGNVTGNINGGTVSGSTGTFTSNVTVGGNISIPDKIIHTDDTNTSIRFPSTDTVSIETAGAEQLRITSDGAIIKGLSNTGRAQFFHSVVNPRVQIEGAGDFDRQISLTSSASTAAYGSVFIFGRQRSGAVGGNTILQADDSIGLLSFQGHDGTNFIEGSRIESNVETGVGGNDMPSNLRFFTNSGTTTITERLRIKSDGTTLINATTVNAGGAAPKLAIDVGDSNLHGITIQAGGGENNGDLAGIAFGHGNTGDIARPKAAIAHIRTGGYGVGDLCFYVDGAGDNNAVATGDEKLRIDSSGHVLPGANDTQDLGSSSKRWRDIYTGDLNLSNKGNSNDVDGSWGDYTIQEGESDLFLINNRSGKKFKFNLTEVL